MSDEPAGGRILSATENFGRVPVGLLLDPDVTDQECRIYAYLTTWDFKRTGRVFPGRQRAADELGCSPSRIDRALDRLEARGAIQRVRRGLGLPNDIHLLADSADSRVGTSADSGTFDSADVRTPDAADSRTPITREKGSREKPTRALALLSEDARAGVSLEADFARAWEHYPRKTARKSAEKAYRTTRRKGVTADALLMAVQNYAKARDGQDQSYTLHGATFFGPNERWRDYAYPVIDGQTGDIVAPPAAVDADEMERRAKSRPAGARSRPKTTQPWEQEA